MKKRFIILLTILFSNFIIGQENSLEESIGSPNNFNEIKYDSIVKLLNYKDGDKITVYTQFRINKKGEIIDIKSRGPHKIFEEKAINIIKDMPKSEFSKFKGKPIETIFTLPITIAIETEKEKRKI